MKKSLCFICLFTVLNIARANEEEINEGHLYHVEVEAQRIRMEQYKTLLESEDRRVWDNCFSSSDEYELEIETDEK